MHIEHFAESEGKKISRLEQERPYKRMKLSIKQLLQWFLDTLTAIRQCNKLEV